MTRFLLSLLAATALGAAAHAADPASPKAAATAQSSALADGSSSLTVRITGLKDEDGEVLVGLYNTKAGFESENDVMGRTVPVNARTESVTFNGIPAGDYALKVFHDEDSDGKLDTGLMGIPSEPYGFSNDASDPFSAPEWEETMFTVDGPTEHEIDLG